MEREAIREAAWGAIDALGVLESGRCIGDAWNAALMVEDAIKAGMQNEATEAIAKEARRESDAGNIECVGTLMVRMAIAIGTDIGPGDDAAMIEGEWTGSSDEWSMEQCIDATPGVRFERDDEDGDSAAVWISAKEWGRMQEYGWIEIETPCGTFEAEMP